jgi:prevent-host-death family protein
MPREDIISLSEFKSDAAKWIDRLQHEPPVVLTQNGKGRAIVQSYDAWRQMQDSLAMLQIVARGEEAIGAARFTPQDEVFADLHRDLEARTRAEQRERWITGCMVG